MIGSLLSGAVGDRFGLREGRGHRDRGLFGGLATAILGDSRPWYYVTAFALGVYIVSDRLAMYNLAMAFSPHEDNTSYLALVPPSPRP